MDRKVVITGMGVIASNGTGKRAFWDALAGGVSGVKEIRSFDTAGYETHIGGEIDTFRTDPAHGQDRAFQLLEKALEEALLDLPAGVLEDPAERATTGVALGTCQGAILTGAPLHRRYLKPEGEGPQEERDRFHVYPGGCAARWVADRLGLGGPRTTLGMACVSSSMAVLYGADLVRRGHVTRMLAGGFEAFSPFIFTGFHSLLALVSDYCRPFDADRSGTVLGEGAAVVVLEEEQAALDRGARIYAELTGAGYSGDAVHLTAPDRSGQGLARAVASAFKQAGIDGSEIGYVNAHGTGTVFNDAMECAAFERVFGDRAPRVPISSLKPMIGHCLGAVGGMEVVASVMALLNEFVPPTLNHRVCPPEYHWDFIPNEGRRASGLHTVMSTNSAFGGNNTALILRRSPRSTVTPETL
jgi:3-oxoacyl-[acyl-carrier-protein] synthase II